jgi:hypothetical protein
MLPVALTPKLDPLIRRLSSSHDGERLAVVAALERVLAAHGASFHDLADRIAGNVGVYETPPPPPHGDDADLRGRIDTLMGCDWLTRWESEFLASVSDQLAWRYGLSVRQRAVIDRLWNKYTARGM